MEYTRVAYTLGREPEWYASPDDFKDSPVLLSTRFVERCIESGLHVSLGTGKDKVSELDDDTYKKMIALIIALKEKKS